MGFFTDVLDSAGINKSDSLGVNFSERDHSENRGHLEESIKSSEMPDITKDVSISEMSSPELESDTESMQINSVINVIGKDTDQHPVQAPEKQTFQRSIVGISPNAENISDEPSELENRALSFIEGNHADQYGSNDMDTLNASMDIVEPPSDGHKIDFIPEQNWAHSNTLKAGASRASKGENSTDIEMNPSTEKKIIKPELVSAEPKVSETTQSAPVNEIDLSVVNESEKRPKNRAPQHDLEPRIQSAKLSNNSESAPLRPQVSIGQIDVVIVGDTPVRQKNNKAPMSTSFNKRNYRGGV